MDRQVCVIKTVAYRAWTETHTHGQILSNDIFYFRTVIIGGPKTNLVPISETTSINYELTYYGTWPEPEPSRLKQRKYVIS